MKSIDCTIFFFLIEKVIKLFQLFQEYKSNHTDFHVKFTQSFALRLKYTKLLLVLVKISRNQFHVFQCRKNHKFPHCASKVLKLVSVIVKYLQMASLLNCYSIGLVSKRFTDFLQIAIIVNFILNSSSIMN